MGGEEKLPSAEGYSLYGLAMNKLFAETGAPPSFEDSDLFGTSGNLRPGVFTNAWRHVSATSSPGFPFKEAENSMVNIAELYLMVNDVMKLWLSEEMPDNAIDAFRLGFTFPATVFVKSEPTKRTKIARLIYGTSLVMNVIGRILFGDYLNTIVGTWHTASHKVGLDFLSEPGLLKFGEFMSSIPYRVKHILVADDIQGWEYQSRDWMHNQFHRSYQEASGAKGLYLRLLEQYRKAELLICFITSDGKLHVPSMYFCVSGRLMTHLQNSFERCALGLVDAYLAGNILFLDFFHRTPLCFANGDDFVGPVPFSGTFSESLGFVHTDALAVSDQALTFCSQIFWLDEDGHWHRKPDGLAKLLYGLFSATPAAALDILGYMTTHEAFGSVCRLYKAYIGRFGRKPPTAN